MKRSMFMLPLLLIALMGFSTVPFEVSAKTPKYAPVPINEYRLKFNKSLAFSMATDIYSVDDSTIYNFTLGESLSIIKVDATNIIIGSTDIYISFLLEDITITYFSELYSDFSQGFGLYDFSSYTEILGGETLVPVYSVLYTDYSLGFDDGASSQAEADASLITSAYDSGYDAGSNQTGIVINDGFLVIAAVVLYALGMFLAWRTDTKWLFAVSGLLWFVPIFLISNLFLTIFSCVMIVFSALITFTGN